MNAPAKTPRDLLDDLQHDTDARHKLAADIYADPVTKLAEYNLAVPANLLVKPRRPPPPPQHCQAAFNFLNTQGLQPTHPDWQAYALLVVVIGAIPFVAPDAG